MSEPTPAVDGVQPVMAPEQVEQLVLASAQAAAELIPAPEPLAPVADSEQAPSPDNPAYFAAFSGSTSGTVVLILTAEMAGALAEGGDAEAVAELVQPALAAAVEASGPCVLQTVTSSAVGDIPGIDETVFIALHAGDTATAWVGLHITGVAGDTPPAPRTSPENSATVTAADTAVGRELSSIGQDSMRMELLRDVEMELSVEIGRAKMLVRDLLQISPGSVIELDRAAGAPADLLVNGRLIARGEVVVIDEEFGLRITQLITEDDPATQ